MTEDNEILFEDLKIKCPVCKSSNTQTIQKIIEIPYFPNLWLFTFRCKDCYYKHSDFINLNVSEPMRYIYHADSKEDYTTKIVRAANGTIRIPQLGVIIEPGQNADGFINNIEGILREVQGKAKFLLENEKDDRKKETIKNYIRLIDQYIEQFLPLDIIVEDPFGNSIIVPYDEAKLKRIKLSKKEAEKLSTSYYVFKDVKKRVGR